MRLKRIEPGKYEAESGRIEITRIVEDESYYRGSKRHYAKQVYWEVLVDKVLIGNYALKTEAVYAARQRLQKLEVQRVVEFAAKIKSECGT